MEETEGRVKETVEAKAGWTRWCVANSDDWFVFVPGRLVAPSTAGRRHWALAQAQGRGKYLAGPIPTGAVHASHRRHASWVPETLYGPGPQGSCFGLAASLPISPSPLDGRGRRTGVGSPSIKRHKSVGRMCSPYGASGKSEDHLGRHVPVDRHTQEQSLETILVESSPSQGFVDGQAVDRSFERFGGQ